jgi:hypothetical protein
VGGGGIDAGKEEEATMTRQTSVEAYRRNKQKIESETTRVLAAIRGSLGDITDREISEVTHLPTNYVWSRRNRLFNKGLITPSCVRMCLISGFQATAWKLKKVK